MSIGAGPDTAQRFNWLITNFVRGTAGVRDAVAVSSDGMLIATSAGLVRAEADHLAAIVSGLTSLARSASRRYDFAGLKLIMIEMTSGFLIVSALGGGTCLGVVADGDADVALIGYEIALLGERVGDLLTPALIAESRRVLPA
ncbi:MULTISPECIES: roadblock/LC7 domain-containing protein [Catenuloplanes]|uniref:Regulator of Ras-like GTPase activity (Roadblock/LC7/MglB family) n=1 Tax=Catenuloplanes niger TaxID=587534 RepID=A0AAE3ZQ87_9ACTN|nr:roadblock/LC7 domain-containing protein [Catenuloplanes niger]MDR7323917.1 putative regulator of Ras-like GTPase activity (Roadblock/LC7/MglB family) [Catenuloplanes niger]